MASRRSGKETDGDEADGLDKQMEKLNLDEKRDINILLLGETGVGKSTFINAFCNYLQYPDLKYAMNGKLTTLIPAKFIISDENYDEQVVQVGEDRNEFVEAGASATQACRSYVFPIRRGKLRIRFIDTPGIGDTRGINQDNVNFENVLSFIGELKHLNAICILLKPNNARLTVMFEFCIKQLLSRLEKSASHNLIFIFTNSRSTFYRPGDTMPALKKLLLEQVCSVDIPLTKHNIFCTDNEAFRFLAAVNNSIKFSKMDIENFSQSWKKSVHECWRMISYIAGDNSQKPLEPHQVKNTISVNEARRLIVQLSQPLAEIAQLIQDNIYALGRHKITLQRSNNTLADLQDKLYVPVIKLKVKTLDQPTTVCTDIKCSTLYKVGELNKWHYHQRCHNPCYLRNVPKEIVGSPELINCAAMNSSGTCTICGCKYLIHMHVYYETETYEDRVENEVVKSEITDKKLALIQAKNIIIKIERRIQQFTEERDIIIRTTAKFACFLKSNAITPYNDAYQAYLEYLIDRERSMGDNADREIIRQFQQMLREYSEEKNALNVALARSDTGTTKITAEDIIECVENLYRLQHNGEKIQELFRKQKDARKDENENETREYVYGGQPKKLKKRRKKNNQKGSDATDSEYATDTGHKKSGKQFNNFNQPPNYQRRENQQGQSSQPTNQNRKYQQRSNQYRGYQNQRFPPQQHHQGYHTQPTQNLGYRNHPNQGYNNRPNQHPFAAQARDNQQIPLQCDNQQTPLQYLQIKQSSSGQFDLRFGNTNARRTPEPQQDLHNSNFAQHSNLTGHPEIPPLLNNNNRHPQYQNYGHAGGYSSMPTPQQNRKPQYQNYGNAGGYSSMPQHNRKPQPRSHSPNPRAFHQGNANHQRPSFHQGQNFNEGANPFNNGPKSYSNVYRNSNASNQEKRHFYNQRQQGQGAKYTGQHPKGDSTSHDKSIKQNKGFASDSGCESYTRKERPNQFQSTKKHFVDFSSSSSSSSSESSDEERYMTCNF